MRLVLAALAATSFVSSAQAADMRAPRGPVYMAPVADAVPQWVGFYIGGNVGYGVARAPNSLDLGFAQLELNPLTRGVLGGGQVGYNWQNGRLVLGVEGDLDAASLTGSQTVNTAFRGVPFSIIEAMKVDRIATARGRIGFTADFFGPVLIYGTGGWAQVHGSSTVTGRVLGTTVATMSGTGTENGYAVGGGTERKLSDHFSLRTETLFVSAGDIRAVITRLGLNYRF